ncbi:murein hydrolase activator EnvC family protein [Paremcibacter congregatus]|uniref:murein hydrolase activator EnvC family protein n=1 Tax=Paremcibacter congregatus TaxID=2043170 RepID=UPI0030EE051F
MPLSECLIPVKTYLRQTAFLLLGGLLCLAPAAMAANAPVQDHDQSEALQDMREKINATSAKAMDLEQQAQGVDEEINELRKTLVTAAQNIRSTASDAQEAEQSLKELNDQEVLLEKSLEERKHQMAKTLAAMQRLSQQPAELVAYRPDKAVNRLRSAGLLNTLLPELEKRAETIQNDIVELDALRDKISREREELKTILATLTEEQLEMNRLMEKRHKQREALRLATREERRKLQKFAKEAKNLQELIAKIEQEAREREKAAKEAARRLAQKPNTAKNTPSPGSARAKLRNLPQAPVAFAQAKGTMPLPAQGVIRTPYGARTADGKSAAGISIHTLPQAMVVSPYEGRIVFAGKFRTYGQMLIIAHGQEYHTLLAGITRLDAEVGQWVLKGEPIGQMASGTQAMASKAHAVPGQNLYVELRRMGKPINPLPYIVARDRKVL